MEELFVDDAHEWNCQQGSQHEDMAVVVEDDHDVDALVVAKTDATNVAIEVILLEIVAVEDAAGNFYDLCVLSRNPPEGNESGP